jgi:RHS repeat-associated protein
VFPNADQQSLMNSQGNRENGDQRKRLAPPSISLPKGGGAIRDIGEKFSANPATGTGSMTVPIATSPSRSEFGPQLSLLYDSAAGNGPFGFGWSLSLPAITRKTDKGLPRYQDAEESDTFLLSGSEDLVPVLVEVNGHWQPEALPPRTLGGQTYQVRRYRPRVEGLFARIERWTNQNNADDTFWRSISKDNITTWYGRTDESRIANPVDPARTGSSRRNFSWLICQSYDDKGNAAVYEYTRENDDCVDHTQASERNRSRTSNLYLKRIKYGNRAPNRNAATWQPSDPVSSPPETWMFELVFDYGEGHYNEDAPDASGRIFARAQVDPQPGAVRPIRQDPFSAYRAGFEVRTYRLCRRALMFHHFPRELGIADCLVRSTEFTYEESSIASFITSVTQSGFVPQPVQGQSNRYLKKSLPPLEFEYSRVPTPTELARQPVQEVDPRSLENLPAGLDGSSYRWVDLDGEGLDGILTEQGSAWFYKRNFSANNLVREDGHQRATVRFGLVERIDEQPAAGLSAVAEFIDLAGDGQVDLVKMQGPVRGFYERTDERGWAPFQPFTSFPNLDTRNTNLRFIDLTGDGLNDILITEGDALTWYPSLGEAGFGPAVRISLPSDEEKGPRLVFADSEQSFYLADFSGDGLSDLARIRNGEVCYWPNLGYGLFGSKVTMDNAPWFDTPDQFNQQRIRLADIDGSGTTDLLYLRGDGVQIYFNQCGNGWSEPVTLAQFPPVDNIASVQALDLLGNGTACLVWSMPLPAAAHQSMCYLALMDEKPHLLVGMKNNLGAETRVHYAPSTKFYLDDQSTGNPWITRLPFPVHVVERVETYDFISRTRFVNCYTYHHGYFDGVEREFRGFGMVEQMDTEEFAALSESNDFPTGDNVDAASHVPPVLTRTWFHTGVNLGRDRVSNFYAGLTNPQDLGEYYREPGLSPDQAAKLLLPDTVLPAGLTLDEEREACRALKGAMLRQEVYALDGTDREDHPYIVTEQNFTIQCLQHRAGQLYAVFFTHSRELITYHYERSPEDPRTQHALTLDADEFGNVLKSAAIAYGRRRDAPELELLPTDRQKQRIIQITCNENTYTRPILDLPDDYRAPLPAEARMYELRKPQQETSPNGLTVLFGFDDVLDWVNQAANDSHDVDYADLQFERAKQAAAGHPEEANRYFRRLIEFTRTLYRPDDLGAAQNNPLVLLPPGTMGTLALPGESYRLAFTPELLARVYRRPLDAVQPPSAPPPENLLPSAAAVLPVDIANGQAADRGGYMDLDGDGRWWMPAGRAFYSPSSLAAPADELTFARDHFFLPHRYRDPFHTSAGSTETNITYDNNRLLMLETRDALGNRVTAGERDAAGSLTVNGNDYRMLGPSLLMDPNRNRAQVAFDALGMVAGTAVMGKPEDHLGDSLAGFNPDPPETDILAHLADPLTNPHAILNNATTRLVYDLNAYRRTQGQPNPQSAVVYTLARETHIVDLQPDQQTKIQHSFSYSDGFSREIQKKIQAEAGPVPLRDGTGKILLNADGQPQMTPNDVSPRWVGSGWTVFNNKGKPVRKYEPFFTDTHHFEFNARIGVSPVLFYDPVERVVATLRPDHAWEKVIYDPWQQTTYDVNDTLMLDPSADNDVKGFFIREDGTPRLPPGDYLPTWHALRTDPAHAAEFANRYPDANDRANETTAANKAAAHAGTPSRTFSDALGRPFLTITHNKVVSPGHDLDGTEEKFFTRIELDIEGNQRALRDSIIQNGDAQGRVVMRYDYDMLSDRIHQASLEAGERWILNDATGQTIRSWDSRGHQVRSAYDLLRRPLRTFVIGADPADPTRELLTGRLIYGEQHPQAEGRNLRDKSYLMLDPSGAATNEAYDFKGNLLTAGRRLASVYQQVPDWRTVEATLSAAPSAAIDLAALESVLEPLLEAETFTTRTNFDALNRPVVLITPRTPTTQPSLIRPSYNEANLLKRVDANLQGEQAGGQPVWRPFVADINYDAKGQRLLIDYGNGVRTVYTYDPRTFRLASLLTRRPAAAFPGDCPQNSVGCQVQNLHYTYDPVGNITAIRDDAQQTIFFRNRRVEPSVEYTYDALYRLIQATGREHLGQIGGQRNPPTPPNAFNGFHTRLDHPGNGEALGTYIERYVYDAVGNFVAMQHRGGDPVHPGWTRGYRYQEASILVAGKTGNRLSGTTVDTVNGLPVVEPYIYDAHGNITKMPHLPLMVWDHRDQLQATAQQAVNNGGTPEITYYVYNASGQRARKVTERQAAAGQTPTRSKERIYLGSFEIYREYASDGEAVILERETLHIMDNRQRIALVETLTRGADGSLPQLIRFQFSNHQGSANLELDDQAQIISYEEFYPYGSTSYQAVRAGLDRNAKRYRYTGKERDEENGLYYHGARYYSPWLGRWINPDPAEVADGLNVYLYVQANPVAFHDPNGKEIEAYNIAPGRPGNQPFMWFLGISAHRLIAYHYLGKHLDEQQGIYANFFTVATILTDSGIGDPSRLNATEQGLKPDITNTDAREVFEIKPWNQAGLEAGRRQVAAYLDALNKGMGVPPSGRGSRGPARYPFLKGIDEEGQIAVQFHGGRMVWRLTWKTTEEGVIQYKWQKTNKTDRDEIRKAGESQWVDITEQDAAAYGNEVYNEVNTSLGRRERLFRLMDATNFVQEAIGAIMTSVMTSAILSAQPGANVPARPTGPTPNLPTRPPVPPPATLPFVPRPPIPPYQIPPSPPPPTMYAPH